MHAPGFEFDAGAVYFHSLYLCADVDEIPLSTGGAQTLSLTAGPAHAGDVHLLLGSFTGTAGFDLGGLLVPLDVDLYFLHTLAHPNAPPLAGSLGFLDGAGAATATLTLPAGLDPSLAGLTFYHACGVLDPATLALEMVSAPVAVGLVL